ncbi:flagellin N-terminal helical domain-containing protein [Pseudoduganella umbonata]|uniref:Flagellin n=1 Tax=Pseudoduganella umbonata TaxID=864828 RepID=A0A4P8HNY3_9BURK|nr:flagellin [Pseudoduganella umbonata]MBB3225125.1 flagellin [Pseudoduganella umbonata]QCP11409.1 flagellin [Pseudoduganella umbonata]
MASPINTNVASLNSQRNLSQSQSALSTSLQRLSSGLRINSAKDDAAGLAISDRMNSQIRGMSQATRNANDGVSMTQTAEGALSSSGDILQRIRELAVQSSNSTNSASDRQALQTEVGQLSSELNRIAQTTTFNGQSLLDGTMGTANFQVGADANQLISANGANFLTSTYGNNRVADDQIAEITDTTNITAGTFTINGARGSANVDTVVTDNAATPPVVGDTAKSIAEKINKQTGDTGVTATARTDVNMTLTAGTAYSFDLKGDNGEAKTISFTTGSGTSASDYASGISAINAQSASTGITAQYDQENGGIKLTHASGNDIEITDSSETMDLSTYKADGSKNEATEGVNGGLVNGRITMDSAQGFSIDDSASGLDLGGSNNGSSKLNSVANLDVTSFEGAQLAIKIADAALSTVNSQRAEYGALQSRFSSTISNLSTTSENLSASRSRIVDTDFASETAAMTRGQILQQAGTAMLAQANSLPNGVMSLLR